MYLINIYRMPRVPQMLADAPENPPPEQDTTRPETQSEDAAPVPNRAALTARAREALMANAARRREEAAVAAASRATMSEAADLARQAAKLEAEAARELARARLERATTFLDQVRSGQVSAGDVPGVGEESRAEAAHRVKKALRGGDPGSLVGWF
jgi:hypothetical protein